LPQIGLRAQQHCCRHGQGPRIHDLRHTFAVRTMINWYRTGKDPAREMIRLTTYLGHTDPDNSVLNARGADGTRNAGAGYLPAGRQRPKG
jgi:integrase